MQWHNYVSGFPNTAAPFQIPLLIICNVKFTLLTTTPHQAGILAKTVSCNTKIIFLRDNDQARGHHFVCEARLGFPCMS